MDDPPLDRPKPTPGAQMFRSLYNDRPLTVHHRALFISSTYSSNSGNFVFNLYFLEIKQAIWKIGSIRMLTVNSTLGVDWRTDQLGDPGF